jgi:spermidine synthase
LTQQFREADITTRYYNAVLHGGAFALPTYIADLVEAAR